MIYIGYEEIWSDIILDGIKTGYEVSTLGHVRNKKTGNELTLFYPEKYSKKKKNRARMYLFVTLIYKNNDGKKIKTTRSVSRLVALAFIPIPKRYIKKGYTSDDLEVDHIRDGDPLNHDDNTIYNLQWLTHKENVKKAQEHNLYNKDNMKGIKHPEWDWMKGEFNANAYYSEAVVRKICTELEKNELSVKDIAKKYDVKKGFVQDIKLKRAWKHISSEYDIENHSIKGCVVYDYKKEDLELMDELIIQGKNNNYIRNALNLPVNKTTSAIISKHRKKLGKNITVHTTYTKEFISRLHSLIAQGYTNKQIKGILNLPSTQQTYNLLSSHRRKITQSI